MQYLPAAAQLLEHQHAFLDETRKTRRQIISDKLLSRE
jgi:hypothetical protein